MKSSQLILANDELEVRLDQHGLVNRVCFPHIGFENHTPNLTHRIGVWADGEISWLNDGSWTHKARYPYSALIGHTVTVNENLGILLEFEDLVEADRNLLIRNIHIVNLKPDQRTIRLFMHQSFLIGNNMNLDTAQYIPSENAVLHYEGRQAFLVAGVSDVGQSFDQHSLGLFGDGRDGTWRDADDGELSGSSSSLGQVDSTIRFSMTIGGMSSRRVHYWLAASSSVRGAIKLHREIKKVGVYKSVELTTDWWRKWLAPSLKVGERLSPSYRRSFAESLMLVRSQIDRRGAIITNQGLSNPTKAAYAIWPLIRLGYKDEVIRFFNFYRQAMTDRGYLMLNYRADGAISQTDKPYDDEFAPLASDATAIMVFMFCQFQALHKQVKGLDEYYKTMIQPMANFLSEFTGDQGLPRASLNFSGNRSIDTYTISLTYAALSAAAEMADKRKDQDSAVKWRSAAEDMRFSFMNLLKERSNLLFTNINDASVDIPAMFGAFMYGLVDFDSQIIKKSVQTIEKFYRLENGLFSKDSNSHVPSPVYSLWMAQYYMEAGRRDGAEQIINKIIELDLLNDNLDAVWVRAELISTLLDTLTRK